MNTNITFCYNIDPLWDAVRQIRDKVESSLTHFDKEISDASKMTSSELIENAFKHGLAIEDGTGIQFEFTAGDDTIRIEVKNKVHAREDFDVLKKHIDEINASNDPEELYLNRLRALMENTRIPRTQLGLYRIAYEGEFKLAYKKEKDILTVVASREI